MRLHEEVKGDGTPGAGEPAAPAVPAEDPSGFSSAVSAELYEDDDVLESSQQLDDEAPKPEVPAPAPAPEPTPAAPPAAPEPPPAPPEAAPPAAAPAVVEPPAAPAPAPAPAPPAEPQAAQPKPPAEPVFTDEDRKKQRETFRAELVKTYDALLTEDDRQAMVTDPAAALPKMAAELHMRTMEATLNGLAQMLPQFIRDTIKRDSVAADNEKEFFSQYKELNSPQGRQVVGRIMNTYLTINPAADRATVFREVGAAAMAAAGIVRVPTPTAPTAIPVPPPAPAPASPSGSPAPRVAAPKPKSDQEAFIEEIIADGRGL